jgi:DNA-binding PadR family transcriptional regulator
MAKGMTKNPSLGDFELFILLAISRLGADAYGTTVLEEVENLSEKEVSVGALYTSLKRLEKKALIESELGEATQERGGRAKKYVGLTASGRSALEAAIAELRRLGSVISSSGWSPNPTMTGTQ